MSFNKTFRETLGFLIVRDNAHQNAFAKALETLGVSWGKLFPVPNYDLDKYPECRKYVEMGFHNAQFNCRLDDTRIGESSAARPRAAAAASCRSRLHR